MKKVITFISIIILIIGIFTVASFAAETVDPSTVVTESGDAVDYFGRIREAWTNGNLAELVSLAGAVAIMIATILLKRGMKSLGNAVSSALTKMNEARRDGNKRVNDSLEAVSLRLEKLEGKLEGERVSAEEMHKLAGLVVAEIKMLDNVYQHSKTIPAAVKDQLAMTYTEAMRSASLEVDGNVEGDEG